MFHVFMISLVVALLLDTITRGRSTRWLTRATFAEIFGLAVTFASIVVGLAYWSK